MERERVRLPILYGSETGTSKEMAMVLAEQCRQRGFAPSVMALDAYPIERLPNETLSVFLVSTTGDGEPPSNMIRFWRFMLRKDLPRDSLGKLRFAVFGFGDSSYVKFNAAARRLRVRLKQLSAIEVVSIGLGDDQSDMGVEMMFDKWRRDLWKCLLELYPLPKGTLISDAPRKWKSVRMNDIDDEQQQQPKCPNVTIPFYDIPSQTAVSKNAQLGAVIENRRLSAEDWTQDVRHVVIKLSRDVNYRAGMYSSTHSTHSLNQSINHITKYTHAHTHTHTGDIAIVWFENVKVAGQYNEMIKTIRDLGLNPYRRVCLASTSSSSSSTTTTSTTECDPEPHERISNLLGSKQTYSVLELFVRYLDVLGRPSRSFLQQLSFYAKDKDHCEKLLELATPEYAALYHDYVRRESRSYLEILHDFDSARPPLEVLLSIIPPLRPRYFSISSVDTRVIHLTVAVVQYKTPLRREIFGLCSNWLASLRKSSSVVVGVKRGSLRLDNHDGPLICVGPGTGVAPMRAMIRERDMVSKSSCSSSSSCPVSLYFGSRHKDKDFLYEEEWNSRLANKTLSELFTAFSRDQSTKIYVQSRLEQNSKKVWNCMNTKSGTIVIAGNSKMASDVRRTLIDIVKRETECSEKDAERLIKILEQKRRIQTEAWS
jgi:sulfite reductase alpha subunit-like flavoprotein